jgi:hypothetical protein
MILFLKSKVPFIRPRAIRPPGSRSLEYGICKEVQQDLQQHSKTIGIETLTPETTSHQTLEAVQS